MEAVLKYRGRVITRADVRFIRELIASNPEANRRALSRKLCEAWGWVQPNGELKDMVCRGMMLALHRVGHIALPPTKWKFRRAYRRERPAAVLVDRSPIRCSLGEIESTRFRQVRRTGEEPLFNHLIAEYHYLGYTRPVGEHLKYLVYAGPRPVACFAWSSAPRHLGPRDRFIGWSKEARRENIRYVAYNPRFLIPPWVEVRHLASHLLGRMVRMLPGEWERVYAHPVYFAETFVDSERFKGTCYRAANWVYLGRTTGRGKDDQTGRPNRSLKDVLGYPLDRRFRELLSGVG
jgi:hypothetical protein